jgi:starch synthase/alpha-amylase
MGFTYRKGAVMFRPSAQPCILFVTPENIFFPAGSEKNTDYLPSQSDGFAGFLAGLIGDLFKRGADVHITQPDYRTVFADNHDINRMMAGQKIPETRVHLAEDRAFFYSNGPESNCHWESIRISLAFQREVINRMLPLVQPNLIHCHGWMTGLIPAMARNLDIPCIFTFQNLETCKIPLSEIEDRGIDAAAFWHDLFYHRFPANYEETRETNPADFLLSGIFAADYTIVVGSVLLVKIGKSLIRFPAAPLENLLSEKLAVVYSADSNYHAARVQHIDLYERLLKRSVIEASVIKSRLIDASTRADKMSYKADRNYDPDVHHSIGMAG